MKTGIEIIAEERQRQIEVECWSEIYDRRHTNGQLAAAAASYALPSQWRKPADLIPATWPWSKAWWKPTPDNRIKELAKAGALIAAEIDRLNRV